MDALLKILAVFSGILLLSRFRLPLGLTLILGGVALDLWAGADSAVLWLDMATALRRSNLWLLLLITLLILELARHLAEEDNAAIMVRAARRWGGRHGRAMSLMALPAAIGLVPMPGGALLSAPFVQQAAPETSWPAHWKSAVNYWFRHVWEYWWPLYPVVFVSVPIFQMETLQFVGTTFWFTPLAMVSGYLFLVRPHLAALAGDAYELPVSTAGIARIWAPLAVVVLCTLLLPLFLPGLGLRLPEASRKMAGMVIGLLVAMGMLAWARRGTGRGRMFAGLLTRKNAGILFTLAGIMIFESLLRSSELLPAAGASLVAGRVPMALVVALLPLVAGLATGNAVGYAGTAFPLVAGLLHTEGAGLTPMATLALAFGFGFAGMMLSPVHLCFVLTRQYFSASYRQIYPLLLPCVGVLLAGAAALYVVFGWLGW